MLRFELEVEWLFFGHAIDMKQLKAYIHSRAESRMAAGAQAREESPDSTWQRCRVTPGRGNPKESATENRPPCLAGDSSLARPGKGETVGQEPTAFLVTGTAWQAPPGAMPNRVPTRMIGLGQSCRRYAHDRGDRVGSLSCAAMYSLDEWSSKGETPEQDPAYRLSAPVPLYFARMILYNLKSNLFIKEINMKDMT